MIEYERRYRLSRVSIRQIENLGLQWSPPEHVRDLTIGLSGARSVQDHGWVLRLRQTNGITTRLEYKAPVNEEWTEWEEIGTEISDLKSMLEILQKIGLKPGLFLDRIRQESSWKNFKLSWDKLRFLGEFIELESDEPVSQKTIDDFLELVGISQTDEARPYGAILLDMMEDDPKIEEEALKYLETLTCLG